ncbi:integrator complex subunit 12 [Asbolus verrucosus]|uniref:Integrator complex subunit 12 n=1 Tax=Asbolus verrucosus TaxID=1661398 RepID=A0A482VX46_ASBVE|nr:integrator complex subunit 12 [Asbolus verrucosus]
MFLNDLDPHFIKSVNYLYSSDNQVKGDTVPSLQIFLEEAIKNKVGVTKDLTGVVASSFKQRRVADFKPFINTLEESKGSSSDNELELDLLKEDLMCIVCNGMDVGARNRLLECSDCHMLYHQECHKPIVTNQDSFDSWDASKKLKINAAAANSATSTHSKVSSSSSSSSSTTSSSSKSNSSSHRHSSSSSYKSSSSASKNDKYSKTNTSSSSKTSSSSTSKPAASSSSTSRTNVTPNINIISADKRIQIMKKKAAKLQERRLTRLTR